MAADGYESNNLLTDNPVRRARGFRAERFIKPPIDLLLMFDVPLDVFCILAESCSSDCGLEVWVPDRPPGDGQSKYDRRLSLGRISTPPQTVARFRNEALWHRVGHGKCRGSWLASRPVKEFCDASMQQCRSLFKVRSLALRIYYVQGPSSPGLRSLEVWALPSAGCSREEKNVIFQAISKLERGSLQQAKPSHPASSADCSGQRKELVSGEGREERNALRTIRQGPKEFYDEITFELMSRPMLLPSGHNVDASTLEKLAATDAQWGRQAIDPFTGVRLSFTCQPLANVGLKARIDDFLLKSCPTTVERNQHDKKVKHCRQLARSSSTDSDHGDRQPSEKDKLEVGRTVASACSSKGQEEISTSADRVKGHEEIVSASLDAALQNLLGAPEQKQQERGLFKGQPGVHAQQGISMHNVISVIVYCFFFVIHTV